jgi:hypothetical protein
MEAFSAFLDKRAPIWPRDDERDAFVQATRRPAWIAPAAQQGDEP